MKSCGIIAEYNPFHHGHAYQIAKARKETQAQVMVVVMSGNFLQRGEPAIIDKWQRANLALAHGADIVIELPVGYAVQAADYFAQGGLSLLHGLGVDCLSFGTDYAGEMDYQAFADFQMVNQEKVDRAFKKIQNNGMNYPQQMTHVYRELFPEMTLDFSSPNHILGMGYAKENNSYDKPMQLVPIKRKSSEHHDEKIFHDKFASGTAIRTAAFRDEWQEIKEVVPIQTLDCLKTDQLISWENLWPLLKYQLIVMPLEELQQIYQMTQGIEFRLIEKVKTAHSFKEFVDQVKTKRFTWTRIQRLCVYVLLHITQEEIDEFRQNNYLRVLGFTEKGRAFLKEKKNKTTLPIITNVSKKNEKRLSLEIRAGQVYQMAHSKTDTQDYYRQPIYLKGETNDI